MSSDTPVGLPDMGSVLDSTEAAVVVLDVTGIIVHANRRGALLIGRPADEIVGTRYDDAPWNLRDRDGRLLDSSECPIGRALAGETVVDAELLVDSPEGAIALLASARPLLGPDGAVEFVVSTSVDVTDVARIEQALSASRSRLSAIFEHASEGIVLADDERRYVAVNPAAARLLGRTVDELLGSRVEDVYVRSIVPDLEQPVRAGNVGGAQQEFDHFRGSGEYHELTVLRHADGFEVVVEVKAVPNVEPGLHLAVWRDVTDRRRMLDDLARSRARLSTIVEWSTYGLLLCDAGGRVLFSNPAAEALLRMDALEGQHIDTVLRVLGVPPVVRLNLVEPTGSVAHDTVHLADGSSVELRSAAVGTSGEVVLSAQDVTAREQLQQALRSALQRERAATEELGRINSLKDTFISAVSHELRTPLTAIGGLSETLRDRGEGLDADGRQMLVGRIVSNTRRLRELLDDLLDLDRLKRGGSLFSRSSVRLQELVGNVVEAIDLGDNHVVLDVTDDEATVDGPKVQRIVENLVANAVRHTPDGTTVTVRAAVRDGALRIDVVDDGPGFPEDLRDVAFDMFVKGSSGRAASRGTGVGLALVREFSSALGGTAALVHGSGGAHVRVTLPVQDEPGPQLPPDD